ncbi:MAG: hypothetical protein AAGA85_27800, partial [Bacteroidota bacterium]
MRKLYLLLGVLTLTYACQTPEPMSVQQRTPAVMSPAAISEQVDTQLQSEVPFRWDQVSNDFLWNVVMQSDSLLVVGYKPSEVSDMDVRLHEISVQDDRWSSAMSRIKQSIQRTYDDLGAGLDVEEEV